ncbi:hypothetical protein J437_LFUL017803, partial [Ladona fulva]
MGNLSEFLNTSSITSLSFLGSQEEGRPDKLNPQVAKYLEEHLCKLFAPKTQLLGKPTVRGTNAPRRRMSVKGAIKKTRSIAVEPDTLGMQGEE